MQEIGPVLRGNLANSRVTPRRSQTGGSAPLVRCGRERAGNGPLGRHTGSREDFANGEAPARAPPARARHAPVRGPIAVCTAVDPLIRWPASRANGRDPGMRRGEIEVTTYRGFNITAYRYSRRASLPIHSDGRARVGGGARNPLSQALLASLPRRFGALAQLRDAPAGDTTPKGGEVPQPTYVGTLEATVYPNQSAHVAYTVFVPFWRQGYAKEGCARMLRHLLDDHRVRVVVAEMDTRNAASISLAEALGFERVGTTLGADHFKGSVSDEHRYELHIDRNS